MPDYFWGLVAFFFAGSVCGMWVMQLLLNKSEQAREAHEREIQSAAHQSYAECKRAPRTDLRV